MAAHAILDAIGIKLDEKSSEYVSALTPASLGQLQEFVSVWTKANQGNEEGALSTREALWNEATNLPMLSLPYCFAITDHKESLGEDYIQRLREVLKRFPDHTGVKWVVARFLPAEDNPSITSEKLEIRRSAAEESPMDAMALGAYAECLYEEKKDVHGAISVLIGTLENSPRNYRFWWSLGYILNSAAADTRGTSLYADINPEDREKFPALNAFASSAIDRGLQINPNSSGLWHMKMKVIGIESGSSPEFMAAFDKAISIDPTFSSPYLTAVYALMPQWGGSIENQIHVLISAYRNIPDNMWIITKLFRQFNETLERLELDPGQSAQDLVRWAKDIRDPAILVGVKNNSTDDLLLCYKTFLRCKDRNNALTVFYQIIKIFKESMRSATPIELQQVEELLSLGDSNEANIMLDLIGKMLKGNSAPGDDYLISLRALVNARGGKVDDALATLKSRIQASRGNEFSRLRYLELGMDQSLDPQLQAQCVADLCPSITGEVDIRERYGDLRTLVPPNPAKPHLTQLLSDYASLLAKGHMASARKDPKAAVNYYLQAAFISRYINNTSLDAAFPSYFVHLWREYRVLATSERAQ